MDQTYLWLCPGVLFVQLFINLIKLAAYDIVLMT